MHGVQNTLDVPNYSLVEASRYLWIPRRTVRRWVGQTPGSSPLLEAKISGKHFLSFRDMVDLYTIERIRDVYHVPAFMIRRAVEELRQRRPDRPRLADHVLKTDGRYIYTEEDDLLINLSRYGQEAMKPILEIFLQRIEHDSQGIARRIYPFLKKSQLEQRTDVPRVVVIDPSVQYGMPVLANSRITTAHLLSRRLGGDSTESIAKDYGRRPAEIEEALIWERGKAA